MIDAELLARNIGIIAEAILAREKPEPAQTNQVAWRKRSEKPENDDLCLVCSAHGAIYLQRPYDGKFMDNVVYWMPIPEIPNRKK